VFFAAGLFYLWLAVLALLSTTALLSGLAPLRYADPLGTFGGSSFKPKQLRCLGLFV
jgi:hypothetical protein